MEIEDYDIFKAMEALDNSNGVDEGHTYEMKAKGRSLARGWHRQYPKEEKFPSMEDRYTSTGEDYEIDSDGCEYKPWWL